MTHKQYEWHKYPQDKPKESGNYLVVYNRNNPLNGNLKTCLFFTGPNQFFEFDEEVIAWTNLPKYKE